MAESSLYVVDEIDIVEPRSTLTITPAPLTITVEDQSCEYNGENQGEGDVTYSDVKQIEKKISVEGLKGNDYVGSIHLNGQGKEVGEYEIKPSDVVIYNKDGKDVTGNYNITYTKGTLEIDATIKFVNEDGTVEYKDLSEAAIQNIKDFGFDCIFTLGGDGTQKSARDFATKGVNIIGVPKTIDNDVACTEITFGYNTAVSVAMEALDRLHTTGETHHRIMVLEVMGRYAGWIALEAAIAGGADVALIPEIPYDINRVATKIENRKKRGKNFSIVVVAEGAKPKDGEMVVAGTRNNGAGVDNTKLGGIGQVVAKQLEELTGLEARNTTLGYMQRGGTPTAFDRVLSTKYGTKAMELALEGKFGTLTVIKNGKLDSVSLEDVVGNNTKIGAVSGNTQESNLRKVTMDDDLVKTARNIGINLGD